MMLAWRNCWQTWRSYELGPRGILGSGDIDNVGGVLVCEEEPTMTTGQAIYLLAVAVAAFLARRADVKRRRAAKAVSSRHTR